MKKKIILAILFLVLIICAISFYIYKTKSNLKDNTKSYICEKIIDWEAFDFQSVNGEDLGKYKSTYSIYFDIKDEKEVTYFITQEKYEFTTLLGLDSLDRENEKNFIEEINEKKLTKIYTSQTFIPINFENYINNDEPLSDYIKDIEILGYTCKEN